MISKSVYSKAVNLISKYSVDNWPEKKKEVIEAIYHLDMWTEVMPNGEKYLWAIMINTGDTTDYRIMKRDCICP